MGPGGGAFREQGSAWKFFVVFAAIFLAMAFGLLAGTGVFRNWGKRGLEEEADRVLYKAVGKLLAEDATDMSASFPKSVAGKSAAEIYGFLRGDLLDAPKIEAAFGDLRHSLAFPYFASGAQFKHQTKILRDLYDARQGRASRMILRLRAWSVESDRLMRQYLKISRAFEEPSERSPEDKTRPPDETDNLFGGRKLILELKVDFGETLSSREMVVDRNSNEIQHWDNAVVFKNENSDAAKDYKMYTEKLQRILALIEFYQRRMDTAVQAERRGLARSLGL